MGIMLDEYNPGAVRLIEQALRDGQIRSAPHTVPNGVKGLADVRRAGRYVHTPRADLMLFDFNLPKTYRREVLAERKADECCRPIPVILSTSSQAEQGILKAYSRNANRSIAKPADLDQFFREAKAIEDFSRTTVTLPPEAQYWATRCEV